MTWTDTWFKRMILQDAKEEPHLTPEQMRDCASRALQASLQLVSRCADMSLADLEKWYRIEVNYGLFEGAEDAHEVEDQLLEDALISDFLDQAPLAPLAPLKVRVFMEWYIGRFLLDFLCSICWFYVNTIL